MGLQAVPAYIGQTGFQHPVELDRNILEGLFRHSGYLKQGDFVLAPAAVPLQLTVTEGRAFLLGVETSQQGGYFVWSEATQNLVFGSPSGQPRIDSVILRVVDTQYGSDPGVPRAEFDIVAGVAAASPTARPDSDFNSPGTYYKPGAWFRMADVRINTGDGAAPLPGGQITAHLKFCNLSTGLVLANSASRPTSPALGDSIYEIDTGMQRAWDGTAWRQSAPYRRFVQLTSTTRPITFNSLPSTLKRIAVRWVVRTATAAAAAAVSMTINNNTGANYFQQYVSDINVTMTPNAVAGGSSWRAGVVPGNTAGAGAYGHGEVLISGWNDFGVRSKLGMMNRSTFYDTAGNSFVEWGGGLFNVDGPYTRIDLDNPDGFMTGSEFYLEGWE